MASIVFLKKKTNGNTREVGTPTGTMLQFRTAQKPTLLHLWLLPPFGDSKGNPYIAKFGDTREGHQPGLPSQQQVTVAPTANRQNLPEHPRAARRVAGKEE